jgi:hypothetical protein
MRLGRVAFGQRGGDARLGPKAGRSFAEMRARHHGDGNGRKLERREKPSKSGSHHDQSLVPLCLIDGVAGCHRGTPGLRGESRQRLRRSRSTDARPVGNGGVDRDLLRGTRATEDLWQGDSLHMRAQIAGPHELTLGASDRTLSLIEHSCEQHLRRLMVAPI